MNRCMYSYYVASGPFPEGFPRYAVRLRHAPQGVARNDAPVR